MQARLPSRIAVVHDWLLDYAGSERVLAEILHCFPQADLFALVDHLPQDARALLGGKRATTTFLQRLLGSPSLLRYCLPLMPFAIEQLDVTGYDLVISSSHTVAKGVLVSPDALHISYIHSPMRYAWDLQFVYLREERLDRGLRGAAARWLLHRLRQWDYRAAAGVDCFVANSRFVARRVLKAYRREAEVICPPVDTDFFRPGGARGDYYLTASRLMGYKRVDLIVRAFAKMPERQLVVVGDGPRFADLKAIASANVQFTGHLPAQALKEKLQGARAFVFAAIEDFGIAPVEAMACGTPVIALRRGGTAESVIGIDEDNPTGVFFDEQTPEALMSAIGRFEKDGGRISPESCRARAAHFSRERFRENFGDYVEKQYEQWRRRLPSAFSAR
jgi:glycosyltransferase involved in cell wall biosynthesis